MRYYFYIVIWILFLNRLLKLNEYNIHTFPSGTPSVTKYENTSEFTILHNNCQIIVPQKSSCCLPCQKYRASLQSQLSNLHAAQVRSKARTDPHSHTNFKSLTKKELAIRATELSPLHTSTVRKLANVEGSKVTCSNWVQRSHCWWPHAFWSDTHDRGAHLWSNVTPPPRFISMCVLGTTACWSGDHKCDNDIIENTCTVVVLIHLLHGVHENIQFIHATLFQYGRGLVIITTYILIQ